MPKPRPLILILVGFALVGLWFMRPAPLGGLASKWGFANTELSYLQIGEAKVAIEIADTPTARARGLSGRARLGENQGLLFIFEQPGIYGFWMKEMNFPIDIIWLDENWRVAGITPNVSPDSYPQVFYPPHRRTSPPTNEAGEPAKIKYVLEVNASWAARHAVKTGQNVVKLTQ